MKPFLKSHESFIDYFAVLGVSQEASPEEIRAAYLKKVKEFPPDRAPEEFERIRDAYHFLRDPTARANQVITAMDPSAPLTDLLPPFGRERKYVGREPWLAVLKESTRPEKKKK